MPAACVVCLWVDPWYLLPVLPVGSDQAKRLKLYTLPLKIARFLLYGSIFVVKISAIVV